MIESYKLSFIDSRDKGAVFGTGCIPNDIKAIITKDISQGIYNADFTIFGLSSDTLKELSYDSNCPPQRQVLFEIKNNGTTYTLFKGLVSGSPSLDTDGFNLNFKAVNFFNDNIINISVSGGTTYAALKYLFASTLKLKLSSFVDNDVNTLPTPYAFSGKAVLTELRKLFPNEYITINNGILSFISKTEKQNKKNVDILMLDITKNIITVSPSDNINAIVCTTMFLPQINTNDSLKINFGNNYPIYYRNVNGTYYVRKVEHNLSFSSFDENDCITTLDLQNYFAMKKI